MLLSSSNENFITKLDGKEIVDLFAEAGFDAIDFGFFNSRFYGADPNTCENEEYFLELKKYADEKGIVFNQAHAPFPSSVDDPEKTREIFFNIVRSMRNAACLGAKCIIVHPMQHLYYCEEGAPETLFEMNMKFYNALKPYCEKYNIKVAIENMWKISGGSKIDHSTCSKPDEFIRYLDALDSEWFVGCLDTGHACLVCEDIPNFIRKLGKGRLKALHVHDVDGINDTHTLPGYGVINWDRVTKALKEIDYDGDFTFELTRFLSRLPRPTVPAALKYAESMGRYLMSKITD